MVVCILQRLAPADDDEAPRADVQEFVIATFGWAAVVDRHTPCLCQYVRTISRGWQVLAISRETLSLLAASTLTDEGVSLPHRLEIIGSACWKGSSKWSVNPFPHAVFDGLGHGWITERSARLVSHNDWIDDCLSHRGCTDSGYCSGECGAADHGFLLAILPV